MSAHRKVSSYRSAGDTLAEIQRGKPSVDGLKWRAEVIITALNELNSTATRLRLRLRPVGNPWHCPAVSRSDDDSFVYLSISTYSTTLGEPPVAP